MHLVIDKPKGGSKMKTRMLVSILILVLAVLIIAGSCVTRRKAIAEEDFFEAWSGTWINTDLKADQKIIIHPDGTREFFRILTSTTVGHKEKIIILDKWLDSKGDIWYRGHREMLPPYNEKGYEMGKINDSGNTWELIWSFGEDYPIEEWEPDRFEYNYRIYYRQ
jgi:hypothetical protein